MKRMDEPLRVLVGRVPPSLESSNLAESGATSAKSSA